MVATCRAEDRRVVQRLLRPLADVVTVAAREELAEAVLGVPPDPWSNLEVAS